MADLLSTSRAVTRAHRALDRAQVAHYAAVVAAVQAEVPGPWQPGVNGAFVEQGPLLVGLSWLNAAHPWTAWACVPGTDWYRSVRDTTPRTALEELHADLRRCRGDHGRAAMQVVVRLLRGWALPGGAS
jgi:hypothetical protein